MNSNVANQMKFHNLNATPHILVDVFRHHFNCFKTTVQEVITKSAGDSVVAAHLGDNLDEFLDLFNTMSLPCCV